MALAKFLAQVPQVGLLLSKVASPPGSLAARMATTQSVISLLEEGGARNRIDTLARVATTLGRHLVVSFPEQVPTEMKDAVQVA